MLIAIRFITVSFSSGISSKALLVQSGAGFRVVLFFLVRMMSLFNAKLLLKLFEFSFNISVNCFLNNKPIYFSSISSLLIIRHALLY